MDTMIQEFVSARRLAIVGVSRDDKKFGNMIYRELKQRGYQPFAVNPALQQIDGDPCFPDLASLQGKVDGVVICIPPARVEPVLREAEHIGVKNVWLQQGAESPAALQTAKDLGLKMVTGKCIMMYAEPVGSFHKFHRFFAKLLGQY